MTTFPIIQNPESDGSSFEWLTGSEVGVVCLHGFTATTVEVKTFARELNMAGYNVAGTLLPGHGKSPEDLNKVDWKDWCEAAEAAYLQMQTKCKYVFMAGESTGALLSLLLAEKYPEIRGLLLYSPALIIHGLWKARFIWRLKPYVYKKNINLDSPWQGFNVIPLHGASELSKLQSKTRSVLNRVNTPAIIFQGKLDRTIDPLSSEIILEKLGSEDKQLVWLAESPHVILLEGQLKEVVEISIDFIQTHI